MNRAWLLLLLAGCVAEEPGPSGPVEPVVVYAAFEDTAKLDETFNRYRQETGIPVILRRGPTRDIVTDLIENRVAPPADILMTLSVVDAWRAAEKGALRPIHSELIQDAVPGWARDVDNLWIGMSAGSAAIAGPAAGVSGVLDYAALGDAGIGRSLCLSSSSLALNRAVIAMLIHELGQRDAELIVRGWVENLAVPPFASEAGLLEALQAGTCRVAIVSAAAARASGLDFHLPAAAYGDVAALGIGRHARNPDGALALAEWLVRNEAGLPAAAAGRNERDSVSLVAINYDDAVKLAERARYR